MGPVVHGRERSVIARPRTHLSYARVISTLGLFIVGGSALFASTATAEAAVYEGHLRGAPATQFDVTISKRDGKRFVDRLDYDGIPFECEDGTHDLNGFNNYFSGNRVRRGAFDIREEALGGFYRHVGELKGGGRAVGTYKQVVDFGPNPQGVCRSGKVEWVATRP